MCGWYGLVAEQVSTSSKLITIKKSAILKNNTMDDVPSPAVEVPHSGGIGRLRFTGSIAAYIEFYRKTATDASLLQINKMVNWSTVRRNQVLYDEFKGYYNSCNAIAIEYGQFPELDYNEWFKKYIKL